jgi:hypothetical protein
LIFYNHLRLADALNMNCGDLFRKDKQPYLRIFRSKSPTWRKDGVAPIEFTLLCVPEAELALIRYMEKAHLVSDVEGPLFRTVSPRTRDVTSESLSAQAASWSMNQRARQAGIERQISIHEFRLAGVSLLKKQFDDQ